jgi:hypothetical protein
VPDGLNPTRTKEELLEEMMIPEGSLKSWAVKYLLNVKHV